jgi:cellulose synthase/poly-beta-1,6-N-acetylglucosamine synthase-like glycosyltransferase
MSILIAILTSRDINKLKRCIKSVLSQTDNIVIVCNTLDFSFVDKAKSVAEKYNLEFLVTKSNGTPSRGKNSVLEIFRDRNHKYYMQVDADDYLAPDALSKINRIVLENPDVDVIGLTNGYMRYAGKETTTNAFLTSNDIHEFANVHGAHKIQLRTLGKLLIDNLQYNRMLLYSNKALNNFEFDEEFIGSEDIVASYKLYYNSEIKYIITDEHLYVYDLEDDGNFRAFVSNLSEINKVIHELKGILNGSTV